MGVAASAHAQNECLIQFDGVPDANADGGTLTCTDCDPACDDDGSATANQACTFRLKACINTQVAGCTAGDLKKAKAKPRSIIQAPAPNGTNSACGAEVGVEVKLKKKGKKAGKKKLKLQALTNPPRRKDKDTLTLICNPLPAGQSCPTTSTTTIVTATTTTSSTTLPNPCGNGTLDAGEQCDPPGEQAQCAAGELCQPNCQCGSCPAPCAPTRVETITSAGTLVVGILNAFPFPAGVVTKIDVGTADASCKHPAIVPDGGFDVPVFCITGLGFTSDVFPLGCEGGTAQGNGSVWDAAAPCPDPDISRLADTSDGSCNPAGQACNTMAGGSGANTLGNIDATRGNGTCDPAGVHTQLDIPVRSLTWSDNDGSPDCPDEDGVYDDGQDNTVTDFNFILSPTTAQARAQWLDQNADGCSVSGAGPPVGTKRCSDDNAKPCAFAEPDCVPLGTGGVTCDAGPLQGSPATGPCCAVGQATRVVATGNAFSGAGPLFDLIFANSSPTTITACNPVGAAETCTLTTDACAD